MEWQYGIDTVAHKSTLENKGYTIAVLGNGFNNIFPIENIPLYYEIINKKHATYYGIAMSVKRICEVIMRDEKSILPVSHMIHGIYGIDGVSLSMPAIVGADGVESDIPINLNGEEALKLKESADYLKKIVDTIEL